MAAPSLPAAELVRRSFQQVVAERDGLFRIGLVWLAVPLAVQILATALEDAEPIVALVGDSLSVLGLSAMAVVWHRHILLGEPLSGPMAPANRRAFRYLGLGFMVGILAGIPGFVVVGLGSLTVAPDGGSLLLLPAVAAGLLAAWVFARLQLVFPGSAIGDPGVGLVGSWRLTRGNGARLLAGILMMVLPVLLAVLAAQLIGALLHAAGADKLGAFLAILAAGVGGWVQAPLVAAFLSYAYLYFREVSQPAPVAAQEP